MSTWICLSERVGFVAFLKLYLSMRKSKFQGIAAFPRVQTWKLLTEVLILAVLRVLWEKGVFQVLNIDLQSSHHMVTFCRSKNRQQIPGERKWILREAVLNGACFPLCATVHVTSTYVAKVKNAWLPTGLMLPSPHNWGRVSNASMIVGQLIHTWNLVSRKCECA